MSSSREARRALICVAQSGAALPLTMTILGREECVARLHRGLEYADAAQAPARQLKFELVAAAPSVDVPEPAAAVSGGVIEALEARGFVAAVTRLAVQARARPQQLTCCRPPQPRHCQSSRE